MSGGARAFYGRWAGLYDRLSRNVPGVGRVRRRVVDAMDLSAGDTVVEMGCGAGANLPFLRDAVGPAGRVVGLDLTRPLLERARHRAAVRDWDEVTLLAGDATDPPVSTADAVLGTFVVGMFDDPAAVVADWCDLVGPGGRVGLLHAGPSPRRWAGPLNALFRLFVIASTPPTRRVRYDEDLVASLHSRVDAGHGALVARATDVVDERHYLGLLRATAGQVRPVDA